MKRPVLFLLIVLCIAGLMFSCKEEKKIVEKEVPRDVEYDDLIEISSDTSFDISRTEWVNDGEIYTIKLGVKNYYFGLDNQIEIHFVAWSEDNNTLVFVLEDEDSKPITGKRVTYDDYYTQTWTFPLPFLPDQEYDRVFYIRFVNENEGSGPAEFFLAVQTPTD